MSTITDYRRTRASLLRKASHARKRGYIVPENLIPNTPKRITQSSINRLQNISQNFYQKVKYESPQTHVIISGTEGRKSERKNSSLKAQQTRKDKLKKPTKKKTKQTHKSTKKTKPKQESVVKSANIPHESDISIRWIYRQISEWFPDTRWSKDLEQLKTSDKDRVFNILESAISELGAKRVAKNVKKNSLQIQYLVIRILYSSGDGPNGALRNQRDFDSGRSAVDHDLTELMALLRDEPTTVEESKYFNELGEELEE